MGEYLNYQGQVISLGTCENLYYVTFDELLEMVKGGATQHGAGNLPPAEYLNERRNFRFRFPFSGNDDRESYDRGVTVEVDRALTSHAFAKNLSGRDLEISFLTEGPTEAFFQD